MPHHSMAIATWSVVIMRECQLSAARSHFAGEARNQDSFLKCEVFQFYMFGSNLKKVPTWPSPEGGYS